MRHVPTTLYVDTEFIKRQGLRLDTKAFKILKETFVKNGIRLLVPAMMEKELLRHFYRQAVKASESLSKAYKEYPIGKLGYTEIPMEKTLIEECVKKMHKEWESFKEHFTVEALPIVSNIETVVDWYLEVKPPFADKNGKQKEFPDAFILNTIDDYYSKTSSNVAVVSADGDFKTACENRRYIWHFSDLEDYINAFKPELEAPGKYREPIDPTKPITTEDLSEIKSIIAKGSESTPIEISRLLALLSPQGQNYRYFFSNAKDAFWFDELKNKGFFCNPPDIIPTENGGYQAPHWPPMAYLINIYERAPDRVLSTLEELSGIRNPNVLHGIMSMILKSEDKGLFNRFQDKILKFIEYPLWVHEFLPEIIKRLSLVDPSIKASSELILYKVLSFKVDPKSKEKAERRQQNPSDYFTSLEPVPLIDAYEYQTILQNGVKFLIEREPYEVCRLLIEVTAEMIRLKFHPDELEETGSRDASQIWCKRLDRTEQYPNIKVLLVNALTSACKEVYKAAGDQIPLLDKALAAQRWDLFDRLRQYLFSLYPSERQLEMARGMITSYTHFSEWEYDYEFQRMTRVACEQFGDLLLEKEQLESIFETILQGPSRENYIQWMGDAFTEERFKTRKRYFHLQQLHPFQSVLFGSYKTYYKELTEEFNEPIDDESYSPVSEVRGGTVSYISPKPKDELASLKDEELLQYINGWDEKKRAEDDSLNEINIQALSKTFQSVFLESIIPNGKRLSFWIENRDNIQRPVYVRSIVFAIHESIKSGNLEDLDKWFEFCEWVLTHKDQKKEEGSKRSDESREHPDWRSSRRAVADLMELCVSEEAGIPFDFRAMLFSLLDKLCTEYDWRLDDDSPVLLNRDDQLTEAINNTRSRSLEHLTDFGYWVRRHDKDSDVAEVKSILERRFNNQDCCALTLPEYAMLGREYGRLYGLDAEWAKAQKDYFFKRTEETPKTWLESFGNFIRFNRPFKPLFDILKPDFEYALNNLEELRNLKDFGRDLADTLGQQLFTYYVWGIFPLTGEGSLIEQFYNNTDEDRDLWAALFDHVGRSLNNSGSTLDENVETKIKEFFEWRVQQKEPTELSEFTFWLEAKCLDAEWRLKSYLACLEVGGSKDVGLSIQLDALNEMIGEQLNLVVECFSKITERAPGRDYFYIQSDKAIPILKAGLASAESAVRDNAERARENLLKAGRFEFLDL